MTTSKRTDGHGGKITICACLVVRNEAQYLKYLLPALARQDIDVAIIDNESTDDSQRLYADFAGKPVISVEHLPFHGVASLVDRLGAKHLLFQRTRHDWIVHHDADEILEHVKPGHTLRDAIEEAEGCGYNALNFEEFVFLPEPGSDFFNRDYYNLMTRYYFFEPRKSRLNRAWKNLPGITNYASGGHYLEGTNLRFSPHDQILRHYIVLSQQHALRKYLHRIYDPRDIQRGWHCNRLSFTRGNLTIPNHHSCLQMLGSPATGVFSRAYPTTKHFWEWR